MRELLHLAQANDADWHGLFGGIYLPHLRRAVWNAMIELESLLDQCAPSASGGFDLDLDGCDEFFIVNGELQAVIRDDGRGALMVVYQLDAASAALETAINLAMPSCDGYLGRYILGADVPGGFGQSFDWREVRELTLEDRVLGGRIVLTASRSASAQTRT